jgi:hypothetical protein
MSVKEEEEDMRTIMVGGEPDLSQTQYMTTERGAREHAELRRNHYEARIGASKTIVLSAHRRNVVRVVDLVEFREIEAAR